MTRHPLIKTLMVLMAALFFTVQGFSQAHAVSNGGVDHSHDGVACDVALVSAEQTVLTPPVSVSAPVMRPVRASNTPAPTQPICHNFDSRAPPPRAPPL